MNEKFYDETFKNNSVSVSDTDGLSADYVDGDGSVNSDTSVSGNDFSVGSDTGAVGGITVSGNSNSVSDSDYVSGGDYSEDSEISFETSVPYVEYNTAVVESLNRINAVLWLIFIFLLVDWTAKKISVSVDKFSNRRK